MTAKEAAKAAVDHLKSLFGDEVAGQPNAGDFRLEEIEHMDDGSWNVTVSFLRQRPAETAPGWDSGVRILGIDANREFKTVALKPDGTVKSVAVRTIAVSG